jgi:hypothetical protein
MRMLIYKNKATDGTQSTHYINLERIDHFTFSEKDGKTMMYALCGDNVHLLNESEKIESKDVLISKLINLSDRSYVTIESMIKDANIIAKTKKR